MECAFDFLGACISGRRCGGLQSRNSCAQTCGISGNARTCGISSNARTCGISGNAQTCGICGLQTCGCGSQSCDSCCLCSCTGKKFVVLSGTICGADGFPAAGIPITFQVDGQTFTAVTDNNGSYAISVPLGSFVSITPEPGLGVMVQPQSQTINNVCRKNCCINFVLSAVVADTFFLSGTVYGTDSLPLVGFSLDYSINGISFNTMTDASGRYRIEASPNDVVMISAGPIVGVTVTPANYFFNAVNANIDCLNFFLSPV